MKNEEKNDEFRIQTYTLRQLAAFYRTSLWTFRGWIKVIQPKLGKRIGHFYNPKQVQMIVDHLGAPFLSLFAFFANFSDALGRSLEVQHHNNDTHNGDHLATDGPASTDIHHTDSTAAHGDAGFDSSSVPVLTTLILMLSQLSMMTSVNPRLSARLRVWGFLFQILVLCVSVFCTGYVIGKAIF